MRIHSGPSVESGAYWFPIQPLFCSRRKDIWGEMGKTSREQCRMDGCYTTKKEWEKHNQKAMTNTIVHIHLL
jgi:hypothetical protein